MTPAMNANLERVIGHWGKPPDDASMIAAGLAVFAFGLAVTGKGTSVLGFGPHAIPRRLFLWVAAFAAALLSIAYIAIYLHGGPRIIDATTYFLQGRALSHGDFTWKVLDPSASFRGRFLLYREGGIVGGIFPPGYPLLLALGFGFGAPMVIGPVLAASLVLATHRLTRAIAEDAIGRDAASAPLVEAVARGAALVSIACAALRYHTADTMAHGATALWIALALERALRGRAAMSGLLVGFAAATRPVSAIPIALVVLYLLIVFRETAAAKDAAPAKSPAARVRAALLAMVPGVFFLLVAQHAVTGSWLSSSQKMYYAFSDGPPGCFAWGFGKSVGCMNEHGEFVAANLPHGYGSVQAVATTLRRLKMHVLDVADFEPLFLLVFVPVLKAPRSRAALAAAALVGLHVVSYAPFYFDGNYPGGGARFFADVLPVEHALLALGVARLARSSFLRGIYVTLGFALGAFAVHASFGHVQLANRDGGRPMFEPDVLARQNVTQTSLVFIDSDHGFALGHDPEARIKTGVVVARLRNDDRDRLLYDSLDHPTTYLYRLDTPPPSPGVPLVTQMTAGLVPWMPPASIDPFRFEAEAEWPALAQKDGFAVPVFTESCSSGNRALVLTPTPRTATASATITLPVPQSGRYLVTVRVLSGAVVPFTEPRGRESGVGTLTIATSPTPERFDWIDMPNAGCTDLPSRKMTLDAPSVTMVFTGRVTPVALDKISLKRLP